MKISKENADRILQDILEKIGCAIPFEALENTRVMQLVMDGRLSLDGQRVKFKLIQPMNFGGIVQDHVFISDPLYGAIESSGLSISDLQNNTNAEKLIPIFCGLTSGHVGAMVARDVRTIVENLIPLFSI